MPEFLDSLSKLTLDRVLPAILLLIVGLLVIKAILKLADRSLAKSKLEKAATGLIRSLAKVVLYLLLGLTHHLL